MSLLEQLPLPNAVVDYLGVYRATPHATTEKPPALLVHGRKPSTRWDVVVCPSERFFENAALEMNCLRELVREKEEQTSD